VAEGVRGEALTLILSGRVRSRWSDGSREHGPIAIRLIKQRDARVLQAELLSNRSWLRPWEATSPDGPVSFDMRLGIRRLLQQYRDGGGVPFVMEYDGEIAGQLNVWGIARGSLSSATIGYWVSERFAGRGITPTAVALATDVCFRELGLHRMEICIRPENGRACGSSRSWASATRAAAAIHPHRGRLARPLRVRARARRGTRGVLQRWLQGRAPECGDRAATDRPAG
jgi:ribosomal-protein-alanine N-acetyltransferase